MIRIQQFWVGVLTLTTIAGVVLIGVGVVAMPMEVPNEQLINPITRQRYTEDEQKAIFRQLILNSKGFFHAMIGCGLLGGVGSYTILDCLLRRFLSSRVAAGPIVSTATFVNGNPMTTGLPVESNGVGAELYTVRSRSFPLHNSDGTPQPSLYV
jgi:hypothetical protein